MTNEEAIKILQNRAYIACFTANYNELEAFDLAIKALGIMNTVTDAKFHDMSDSPMIQYKKGWNDALDAVKIKFESEDE